MDVPQADPPAIPAEQPPGRSATVWIGCPFVIAVVVVLFRSDVRSGYFAVVFLAFYALLRKLPVQALIVGWIVFGISVLFPVTAPREVRERMPIQVASLACRLLEPAESATEAALGLPEGHFFPGRRILLTDPFIIFHLMFHTAVLATGFSLSEAWPETFQDVSTMGCIFVLFWIFVIC